jgi:hypothetical protein
MLIGVIMEIHILEFSHGFGYKVGGVYAKIVHRPSWRYARVGYTNGVGAQARFSIGSVLMAV